MSTRRCDALCHQAKRENCHCWCGGRYHGCGPDEARRRFLEDFDVDLPESRDFAAIVLDDDTDSPEIKSDHRKVLH